MPTHSILGGKVNLYRREDGGDNWFCSTYFKGKNRRKSTKTDSLTHAEEIAEDWFLELRGKSRAGLLDTATGPTFNRAADIFEEEYEISTNGERSSRGVAEHKERERRRRIMLARRDQMERLEEGEDERWSELRNMAAGWEEAGRLRSFVDAVSHKLAGLKPRPARTDLWLAWARERIDALDPFLGEADFVYESVVAKPREEEKEILSEYEREFGEPDPDDFVE